MIAWTKRILNRVGLSLMWIALMLVFLLVVLWNDVVRTTPVGSASVLWHKWVLFGGANSYGPLGEGIHVILPWDKFYTYDLRLQQKTETYQVVSADGLHFEMEITFRWRVNPHQLVDLNTRVGSDYLAKQLVPEIGSMARTVVAKHKASDLYSSMRSEVQSAIYEGVVAKSLPNGIGTAEIHTDKSEYIALQDVLITRVKLPEPIQQAIESKLREAQKVAEFGFRVEREKLESERKRIEGEGIAAFQEIVTPAISESYLRWRGIEATLELAKSNNSKVVVIGNSQTGLPLILDTGPSESSSVNAPQNSQVDVMKAFHDAKTLHDMKTMHDAKTIHDAKLLHDAKTLHDMKTNHDAQVQQAQSEEGKESNPSAQDDYAKAGTLETQKKGEP